jgi:hypothetical protein
MATLTAPLTLLSPTLSIFSLLDMLSNISPYPIYRATTIFLPDTNPLISLINYFISYYTPLSPYPIPPLMACLYPLYPFSHHKEHHSLMLFPIKKAREINPQPLYTPYIYYQLLLTTEHNQHPPSTFDMLSLSST